MTEQKQSWFKVKVLPHLVAVTVFAAVTALFFLPQFEGKALSQTDMVQVTGMRQDIQEHIDKYGEHPQWAGRAFSGMPSYLLDMNYEGRWVKNVADQFYILGKPASWIFIAMAGFYLMLLMFGVNPWLGIIGGLAYGLSSYFVIIIGAGHITKMMALAWIPPLLGSVWYAYRKNMWLGAVLTGLFASVEISTSHPQIVYYFFFAILALAINELVRAYKQKLLPRFAKVSGLLLLAAALAVGSNIVQLYYVADYSMESTRGKSELTDATVDPANQTSGLDRDYATEWSYGKLETLNLLVPNLYGGGHDFAENGEVAEALKQFGVKKGVAENLPSYWGPQRFTEGPVYVGAVMIFLCVLGLFVLRGRDKWWILAVSIIAVMLAWGRYFMGFTNLFLDYVPMYNKFRTVSMILVIVEWSVPLLGILGLQRIWKHMSSHTGPGELDGRVELTDSRVMRGLGWSVGIVGGLCLLIALIGPMFSSFSWDRDEEILVQTFGLNGDDPQTKQIREAFLDEMAPAMAAERESLMRRDGFRSLAFVLLAAGLVWLYCKRKVREAILVAGLGILVVADLFTVDKRYLPADRFGPKRKALTVAMTEADRLILQDQSDYRVANFSMLPAASPFEDATTSYYHRSIGGYHAAKLGRYNDLIGHQLMKQNWAVYDMLNVKYVIRTDPQTGQLYVEQNPAACGSAWFVDTVERVDTPDQEIAALDDFDPSTTAVVDQQKFGAQLEGLQLQSDSAASILLTDYRVNRLTYQTRSDREGLVVFSEVYYPKGWTATIDGTVADYFRADYVLRAMRIPAGEHTIEFSFAAPHFGLLVWITRISSLVLLLGAAGLIVGLVMQKRKENHIQA